MIGKQKEMWRAPGCRIPHLDGCCRRLDDLQLAPRMLAVAKYSPLPPAGATLTFRMYQLFGDEMDTLLDEMNEALAA